MDPKIPNPGYLFSIRRFGIKESLSLGIPTKLCTGRFTAKPPPSEQKAQKAIADKPRDLVCKVVEVYITHQVTHQVQLHLVNDSSQGSSSPLSSVTGRAAIGLDDQLLVHEEVHLPSSPSLQLVFK